MFMYLLRTDYSIVQLTLAPAWLLVSLKVWGFSYSPTNCYIFSIRGVTEIYLVFRASLAR